MKSIATKLVLSVTEHILENLKKCENPRHYPESSKNVTLKIFWAANVSVL
jgi:hypothetical protein